MGARRGVRRGSAQVPGSVDGASLNIIVLSWLMKKDGQGLRIAVDARREANGGGSWQGKQTDMREGPVLEEPSWVRLAARP